MKRYDLIAIGGGTAGLVTSAGAAAMGLKVALVEREALGGDCLWTGCVPSKALIASAKLAHQMRNADRWGLTGAAPNHVFANVMERMRSVRSTVARHDDPQRFRDLGVDVQFGEPRFTSPDQLQLNGTSLSAKRFVIATGAVPLIPPIDGLDEVGYLTHHTAFDQDTLPSHVVILGGGPIGLEFAQVYRRLGADVTVVEMLPSILEREEAEASAYVTNVLTDEGINVRLGEKVVRVTKAGIRKMLHTVDEAGREGSLVADEVFVATGRRANAEGLGLQEIGVELHRGAVKVDENLRSTRSGIWAAGDVAGGLQFTHVAEYQAKLVLRNAVFPFRARADYSKVPWVTFTDPEVAHVGLTEPQARDEFGNAVTCYRYDFDDLDRAIVDGEAKGFMKIVTGRKAKILGATVVASGGGNLLTPIILAMNHKIPLPKLSQMVYPYPTMSEGVKRAADSYYRAAFAGKKGDWFRKVVRWLT